MIAHRKCPFCSGRDLEAIGDGMVASIYCKGCGARGPHVATPDDDAPAWAAWNNRRCASLIAEEKGEKDAKQ